MAIGYTGSRRTRNVQRPPGPVGLDGMTTEQRETMLCNLIRSLVRVAGGSTRSVTITAMQLGISAGDTLIIDGDGEGGLTLHLTKERS